MDLTWIQWLLDSHALWLKRELIDRGGGIEAQSQRLFQAPFVVVSHADSDDPILNYGNRQALDLWEMDWPEFTATPSRLTAEPVNRDERARMLRRVEAHASSPTTGAFACRARAGVSSWSALPCGTLWTSAAPDGDRPPPSPGGRRWPRRVHKLTPSAAFPRDRPGGIFQYSGCFDDPATTIPCGCPRSLPRRAWRGFLCGRCRKARQGGWSGKRAMKRALSCPLGRTKKCVEELRASLHFVACGVTERAWIVSASTQFPARCEPYE